MKPMILAIRAVGVEFANRIFMITTLLALGASVLFIILIVWLTSMSGWWWIFATVLIAIMSIALLALFFARAILKWAAPSLTRDQKKQTKTVVDKLEKLSEATQTPKPLLLFFLVRDVISPRENGFIATLSQESLSVKQDFVSLARSFHT